VRPVLDTLGIVHKVGGPGAGYVTKLLVNLLWFGQAVATTEALLLGARCGVDPETLAGVLGESRTAGGFIRRDLNAVLDGDHLPEFAFDRCCEQLDAITKLAHEQGVPFTVSDAVWLVHERALARFGPVDGELMAVAHLQSEAGISLRRIGDSQA
jgi:3-hydroxyisobutyrate dehydrogenase